MNKVIFGLTEELSDEKFTLIDFPNEVLIVIIYNLNIDGFRYLLQTCKFFATEFDNEYIWKILAENKASDIYNYKPKTKTYKWLCLAKACSYIIRDDLYIYGHYTEDEQENGYAISKRNHKILSGHFKDGKLDGEGTCWWNNGNVYIGTFSMNELEGEGTFTHKNYYYTGGWLQSKRHGKGEIVWNNGERFVGNFRNGVIIGYGEYYWLDGCVYKGDWISDNAHGNADITWASGVRYVGKCKDNLREGPGTLYWPDGDKYIGNWKKGARYGSGIFISSGGTREKQLWKEKERISYKINTPLKKP